MLDLPTRRLALRAVHFHGADARQSPLGAVDDRGRHLQITQQSGGPGGGGVRFRGSLGFEKQFGLVEQALAGQGRAVAPGRIQLPGLPAVAVMLDQRRSHPQAVLQIDACRRDQILHRHVRGDFALAHLLLDGLRQKLDQRQPPRHPAHAAVKPAPQFIESVAEALLHLRQQPALFQRGLVFGEAQRAVQHQSLGFAQRPDHRFHRVPAQLLERRQAFVTVDDQVAIRRAFGRAFS